MTSGQFSVERPTVTAAVTHVADVHGQIDGLLSQLRNRLEPVLSNPKVWAGAAQKQFALVHTEWESATKKINVALDNIGQALQQSNSQYEVSDTDAGSTIGSTAVGQG
ncbi:MAG: WXG100 family type VII secretion target [Jatrophihabitans sp.]